MLNLVRPRRCKRRFYYSVEQASLTTRVAVSSGTYAFSTQHKHLAVTIGTVTFIDSHISIHYSLKVLKVHIYYSPCGNSIRVCIIEHTIVRFIYLKQMNVGSFIIKSKTRMRMFSPQTCYNTVAKFEFFLQSTFLVVRRSFVLSSRTSETLSPLRST